MLIFEVVCGNYRCAIEVKTGPSATPDPTFVATPFLVHGDTLQPIAREGSQERVELLKDSEVDALEAACVFLERRLGPRDGRPRVTLPSDDVRKELPPRRLPLPPA